MKQKHYVSLGILFSLALGGISVYANSSESNSTTILPEYVVTATRSMKTQLNSPANTVVITQKDIKLAGYNNAYQAIHQLAQVNTDGYTQDGFDFGSMVSKMKIRGLDQGTLVLLNGNPIDYTNYAMVSGIPLDQIKKIEVVKGSGSVLYGSAAIAGTINIITKTPQPSDKVTATANVGFGSQRKAASLSVDANNVMFGISGEKFKDQYNVQEPGTTGEGTTVSILDKHASSGYAVVRFSPTTTLSYSHDFRHTNFLIGNYNKFVAAYNQSGDFDTTTDYWNLTMHDHKTGWKATAGWNGIRIKSTYNAAFAQAAGVHPLSDGDNKAHTLNLDVSKRLSVRDHKDSLILGGTFTQNKMDLKLGNFVNSSDKTTSYALYQSYEYNPTPKVSAFIGMREYHMKHSKYQENTSKILPQLQLLYRDSDHSSYYASVGRSFVMPRINYGFFYGPNIKDAFLKPQDAWDYEFGYKFDNGKTRLTTDVFHLDVTNKFSWGMKNGQFIMMNLDKWHNTGLEFNARHTFSPMWSGRTGITWQAPVAIDHGKSSQDSAKILWNTGATYTHGKIVADMDLFLTLKREHAFYNETHQGMGGVHPVLNNGVDLRLALHYKPNATDTVTLVGTNLLNRKNVIDKYQYVAPSRAVYVSYGHKF